MKNILSAVLILIVFSSNAQTVIPLYNGAAPGSENWNWEEKQIKVDIGTILMDVSHPSLTAYVPSNPNGTAVIIAPGGAFHALAFDLEGIEVAKRLNAKGISSLNAPVIPLALQDGLTAVKYVRQHANEYRLDPNKIGFMGFSAGGTVTMSVVYSATDESRPNFVAPVYAYENAIIGSTVPSAKTAIFIAAASDDDLGFATHSVHIYLKWLAANQPAELHMYEKGRHGFGTKKQSLPVDTWMDRFTDWLGMQGLLKK